MFFTITQCAAMRKLKIIHLEDYELTHVLVLPAVYDKFPPLACCMI